MKKLNITKEQFNRSRYFKNKYGKLEYVSESGKLFKTNKGKVLMFKEGIKPDLDFDDDFDDEGHLDADEDNPKFSIGDKVIIVAYAHMTDEEYNNFEPSIVIVDEHNDPVNIPVKTR